MITLRGNLLGLEYKVRLSVLYQLGTKKCSSFNHGLMIKLHMFYTITTEKRISRVYK